MPPPRDPVITDSNRIYYYPFVWEDTFAQKQVENAVQQGQLPALSATWSNWIELDAGRLALAQLAFHP
jgi:hypothetical protein